MASGLRRRSVLAREILWRHNGVQCPYCQGARREPGHVLRRDARRTARARETVSGGSRIFARGVRQLVPLECPKPLHALSPSDP